MPNTMSLEQRIADLTVATTNLLDAVNVRKSALDAAENNAAASASAASQSAAEAQAAAASGTVGSLAPEAGKIPLAGEDGKIASEWVRDVVTARTGPGGGITLSAGDEALQYVAVVQQGIGAELPARPTADIVHWYSHDYIAPDLLHPYDQVFPSGPLRLFERGQLGAVHDAGNRAAVRTATGVGALNGAIDVLLDKSVNLANALGSGAARPTLNGRVNRCNSTHNLSTWTLSGLGGAVAPVVTPNADIAPDGTQTAVRIDFNCVNDGVSTYESRILHNVDSLDTAELLRTSIWVKAATPADVGKKVRFAHSNTSSPYNGYQYTLTDDWVKVDADPTRTSLTTTSWSISTRGTYTQATASVLVWRPDIRYRSDAALPYQEVRSVTDYDTAGFPLGAKFDGTDDALSVASGGGSTTSWFFCASIRFGKRNAVQTLFSDAGTNTGYIVRINASNQVEVAAGNGTAYTTVTITTPALVLGDRVVITAWHDDSNLYAQINDGDIASAAFVAASAGSASYTIGKDNAAASGYFGGTLYTWVVMKNAVLSAANRDVVQAYCAGKARVEIGA